MAESRDLYDTLVRKRAKANVDAKANVIKLEHSGMFRNIYTDYREKGEIRPGHQTSSPFFVLFFLFLSFPIFFSF